MNHGNQLPGLLGQMLGELQQSGIAAGLIRLQLIATASLLTQGVADVEGPMGGSPIGVPGIGVHPSGAGKSAIFRILLNPIVEALNTMPSRMQGFVLEDATREAVVASLKDCPVAGIFTDEMAQLSEMLGVGAPTLTKLMDGSGIRHARIGNKNSEDKQLRASLSTNTRLTALLLVQPQVLERMKSTLGAGEGGQGHINRYACDDSHARLMNPATGLGLSEQAEADYKARIRSLLESTSQNVLDPEKTRPVIKLSPEAMNHCRAMCGAQVLGATSEYASRHVQRVLRMAGAIHVFEYGPKGELGLQDLFIAEAIDRASIEAFTRLTYVPPKLTQAEMDAQTLMQAIAGVAPNTSLRLKEMRKHAPNLGMTKTRFDKALPLVCSQGHAWVRTHEGEEFVQFTPRIWTAYPATLAGMYTR